MADIDPSLGNTDLAVKVSKELETILVQKFNADGRGLHEKVSSVQKFLPEVLVQKLRSIATVRNKTIHEDTYEMDELTRQIFIRTYEEAKQKLHEIEAPTLPTVSHNISQNISTYISTRTSTLTYIIPEQLKTFSTGLGGIFKLSLSSITGEVVELKEQTRSAIVTRKVWLRLKDGREHYFECQNLNFLARKGHVVTPIFNRKQTKLFAVYNHQIDQIFYLDDNIKPLFPFAIAFDLIVGFAGFIATSYIIYIIITILPSLHFPLTVATGLLMFSMAPIYAIFQRNQRIKALKQHIAKAISSS